MGYSRQTRPARAAFSLVEIIVVIVVIAVFAAILYPRMAGQGRTPAGKATTPISKAKDTVCLANLQSARQSVAAMRASDPDGAPAASLQELRLPAEVMQCEVSKQPYQYDPTSGAVRCPFPAHSSY